MVKLVDTPAGSSSVTGYDPFDSACAATAFSAATHDTSKASVTHLLSIVVVLSTFWIVSEIACYLDKGSCPGAYMCSQLPAGYDSFY